MKRILLLCLLGMLLVTACMPGTSPALGIAGYSLLPGKFQEGLIKGTLVKMRHCQVDQDCVAEHDVPMVCPFGCNIFRNRIYEDSLALQALEGAIDVYAQRCPPCVYDCPPSPDEAEIGCREDRCVDLRFYGD